MGDVLVDREGVEFDIVSAAQFSRFGFGDLLKGVEDMRLEFVRGLLPSGLEVLDFLLASVSHDDVEVALYP